MMYERNRLHPASIVVTIIRHLREFFFPLIIFVFFGIRDGGFFSFIYYGAIFVLFTALIGYGVAYWYRFSYWVEEGELRIESGVFVKKRRFIPQERIQTIDTSEGLIQRIFDLVKVQVETAGGGSEAEAVLSAVTKDDAQQLRTALLYKVATVLSDEENEMDVPGDKANSVEENEVKPTYTISWKHLFIVGTTSGGIGVVLSAVVAFVSQFDQFIPYEDVIDRFDLVLQTSVYFIATVVFFVLFLSWLISILMTMFKYGNFTVVKQGEELLISRGIIEKRQLTIPLGRIQAIRISQNILRQPFGLATVYVESAGSAGGKEADFATILFPLVRMKEIEKLIREFTPSYNLEPLTHALPKRSFIRYLLRLVLPASIISAVVAYLFQPYGFLSFILVGLAAALAYGQYKAGGWNISDTQLQLSYRIVNKNIVMIHKKRVQSFEWKESRFQRRRSLHTISAAIKSSVTSKRFRVVDVEQRDGHEIFNWYTYQKKQG